MADIPGGDKIYFEHVGIGIMNGPGVKAIKVKISTDSLGPLHRHPMLEEKLQEQEISSRTGLPPKHVIVDEDDWKEARDAIKIMRGVLTQKEALPTLLGLNPVLDKKIHKALEEQ